MHYRPKPLEPLNLSKNWVDHVPAQVHKFIPRDICLNERKVQRAQSLNKFGGVRKAKSRCMLKRWQIIWPVTLTTQSWTPVGMDIQSSNKAAIVAAKYSIPELIKIIKVKYHPSMSPVEAVRNLANLNKLSYSSTSSKPATNDILFQSLEKLVFKLNFIIKL